MEYILDEKNYKGNGKIKYIIDGECWICIHPQSKHNAYLVVTRKNKQYYMHRYIYELYKGKIPEGMVIMHKCDNPKCINPKHLEVGTQLDNIRDMHSKGRAIQSEETRKLRSKLWSGKNNPMYGKKPPNTIDEKLKNKIKDEINKISSNKGKWSEIEQKLSIKYNVSISTIRRIKYNYYNN